jgi:hypothetical protein
VSVGAPSTDRSPDERQHAHRRRAIPIVVAVVLETAALWFRSHRLGGNVVVRCRDGHLFTTIWIPGASVKSLRLGLWRVQHCPVGHHWTIVTPIREADLSDEERRSARERHDIRLP